MAAKGLQVEVTFVNKRSIVLECGPTHTQIGAVATFVLLENKTLLSIGYTTRHMDHHSNSFLHCVAATVASSCPPMLIASKQH